MPALLGPNQYGKAEIRLVRLTRERGWHDLADLSVDVTLAGDLAETHLTGDNTKVLPTDTQKNTVYAFAREHGVSSAEAFGLRLARHFVDSQPAITKARVSISEYGWRRLGPHSFARTGEGVRTVAASYDGSQSWLVAGVTDLVLMNSTGSRFHGFVRDAYTTLAETSDRILATEVQAAWRYRDAAADWHPAWRQARSALVDAFVDTDSRSLQQTLYAMGAAVLSARPEIVEVRLSLPNKHHFLVDLAPFGLDNPGEVFHADDRPYGLIEGTVLDADAPPPGLAWSLSG